MFLLPYIEQDAMYKEANVASYPGRYTDFPNIGVDVIDHILKRAAAWPTFDVSWRRIRGESVKAFVCPSDRGHEVLFTDAESDPSPQPLSPKGRGAPPEPGWARGNYAANAGAVNCEESAWGMQSFRYRNRERIHRGGGLVCQNWGAQLGQIPDGTAFTVMFNEVRVGVNAKDRRGVWAMGIAGSSITCGNALDANPTPNNTLNHPLGDEVQGCHHFWTADLGDDGMGCVNWGGSPHPNPLPETGEGTTPNILRFFDYSRRGQARSRHPGGVNSCFAYGSVRFVRNDVPVRIWRSMLTRDGDESTEDKPYQYDFD